MSETTPGGEGDGSSDGDLAPGDLEPTAPTPAAEVPTEPVTPAAPSAPPPGPPPWPDSPGATPPGAALPASGSSHVAVPTWVLLVVAGVGIAAIFFALGWIAAPGGDDRSQTDAVARRGIGGRPGFDPFGNGNRGDNGNGGRGNNGDGNGSGPLVPSPAPSLNAAFLGVATESSSDPQGARVVEVASDTPAEDGGLEVGDVITKVDDQTVAGPAQLATRIQSHDSGDQVTITFTSDGATETARVRLTSRRSAVPIPPQRIGPSS